MPERTRSLNRDDFPDLTAATLAASNRRRTRNTTVHQGPLQESPSSSAFSSHPSTDTEPEELEVNNLQPPIYISVQTQTLPIKMSSVIPFRAQILKHVHSRVEKITYSATGTDMAIRYVSTIFKLRLIFEAYKDSSEAWNFTDIFIPLPNSTTLRVLPIKPDQLLPEEKPTDEDELADYLVLEKSWKIYLRCADLDFIMYSISTEVLTGAAIFCYKKHARLIEWPGRLTLSGCTISA